MEGVDFRLLQGRARSGVRERAEGVRKNAARLAGLHSELVPADEAGPVLEDMLSLGLSRQPYSRYGLPREVVNAVISSEPFDGVAVSAMRELSAKFTPHPSISWPVRRQSEFLELWAVYRELCPSLTKKDFAGELSVRYCEPSDSLLRRMKYNNRDMGWVQEFLVDELKKKLALYTDSEIERAGVRVEEPLPKAAVAEFNRVVSKLFPDDLSRRGVARFVSEVTGLNEETVHYYISFEGSRHSPSTAVKRNDFAFRLLDGLEAVLQQIDDGLIVSEPLKEGEAVELSYSGRNNRRVAGSGIVTRVGASDSGLHYGDVRIGSGKVISYIAGVNPGFRGVIKGALAYDPDSLGREAQVAFNDGGFGIACVDSFGNPVFRPYAGMLGMPPRLPGHPLRTIEHSLRAANGSNGKVKELIHSMPLGELPYLHGKALDMARAALGRESHEMLNPGQRVYDAHFDEFLVVKSVDNPQSMLRMVTFVTVNGKGSVS